MGIVAVTSAANHDRILFGQEWLKTKGPAEEVLIIGSTLAATNEIARSLIREKRAAFGYHRLSWGQFASSWQESLLTMQRIVPLRGLGVQAVAGRVMHKLVLPARVRWTSLDLLRQGSGLWTEYSCRLCASSEIYFCPPVSIAASTFGGDIGSSVSRRPVALSIALAIAAIGGQMLTSATPLAPYG
jgi:hypothetical protein